MALGLDSITDVFTGEPLKEAANKQQAYIGDIKNQVGNLYDQAKYWGQVNLGQGYGAGIDALLSGSTGATKNLLDYLGPALSSLNTGYGGAVNNVTNYGNSALDFLTGNLNKATGAYGSLADLSSKFASTDDLYSSMMKNALGLGGPDGNTTATSAFQAGPGYKWQVDQALEGVARGANSLGMGASGNTLTTLQDRGNQLANQEYQKWLDNMYRQQGLYAPLSASTATSAASGLGNLLLSGGKAGADILLGTGGKLSDLLSGQGKDLASLFTGIGGKLSGIAGDLGTGLASLYTGQGKDLASLISNLNTDQVKALLSTLKPQGDALTQSAAADLGASQNIWKGIEGAAKLFAGLPPIPSGGSGMPMNLNPVANFGNGSSGAIY